MHRYAVLPLSLLLVASCGRDPRAQADTVRSHDSAAGDVTYSKRIIELANGASSGVRRDSVSTDTTTAKRDSTKPESLSVKVAPGRPKKDSLALVGALRTGIKTPGWPVKSPEPAEGAVIPAKRIIAFYGNPLSKKMGVLGALPPNLMLAKLEEVARDWQKADPETPVQPALHLIAVVAQGAPGTDGKYRLRMDSSLIEQVYGWAQQKGWLLFLDIQTGQSTVKEELPPLMKFLERPNVHLGIDPEFHMHYEKEGVPPGKKIGTLSSAEVNYAVTQLAKLVEEKKLPPKVLIVHRFTRPMLKGYDRIKLDPRVQVVVNMDGWGQPWLKFDSYRAYVVSEPVQFTGFKLFYGNDTKKGDKLLTPLELLQLKPRPIYIQYQ